MSSPSSRTAQVVLKPRKKGPFVSRHPWVLEKSLLSVNPEVQDGQEIDVVTPRGDFIARGIYNSHSYLRVRLYSWTPGRALDEAFWRERLESAVALRRTIGYDAPQGAARLVFSEADGLSGLIVDRYGDYLVVQLAALAMAVRKNVLVGHLAELISPRGIYVRTDPKIARSEGMEADDGLAWGDPAPASVTIEEHGLVYAVDVGGGGQKTGYYLDQRENRLAAAHYLRGRRVLDMFSYAGGFALTAARLGNAAEVLGVDSSQRAIEHAQANAAANGIGNVHFEVGEAFKTLERSATENRRFDAVILDPPRFAGSRQSIDQALRAYHRLNRLGVAILEPGGILVTCSCSGRVSRNDFFDMLFGVAQKTRRDLQILESRGASPDHPVRVGIPESDYLKCVICRVE
jgi:23S rRNA (cytosine1962-C5)-methyltransferase